MGEGLEGVLKGSEGFERFEGVEGFERFERFEGFEGSQTWLPREREIRPNNRGLS